MPIEYDARSLVPDFTPAIRSLMGAVQERKEQQARDESLGIASELSGMPGGLDYLLTPENGKALMRLNQLDPQAFQGILQIAATRDGRAQQKLLQESEGAARFYQAFLDTEDPAERNRFLASQIRTLEEQGQDASKLRNMIGLNPDQQRLQARRQLIMAGYGQQLADSGLKALQEQIELQNKMLQGEQIKLGMAQTGLQMQLAQQGESRAQAEARRDQTAFERDQRAAQMKQDAEAKRMEQIQGEGRRAWELTQSLLNNREGLAGAAGTLSTKLPTFRAATVQFEDDFAELQSLLTLENLNRMTGVLSESDIKLLREAASGLTLRDEKRLRERLPQIAARLEAKFGIAPQSSGATGGWSIRPKGP